MPISLAKDSGEKENQIRRINEKNQEYMALQTFS